MRYPLPFARGLGRVRVRVCASLPLPTPLYICLPFIPFIPLRSPDAYKYYEAAAQKINTLLRYYSSIMSNTKEAWKHKASSRLEESDEMLAKKLKESNLTIVDMYIQHPRKVQICLRWLWHHLHAGPPLLQPHIYLLMTIISLTINLLHNILLILSLPPTMETMMPIKTIKMWRAPRTPRKYLVCSNLMPVSCN